MGMRHEPEELAKKFADVFEKLGKCSTDACAKNSIATLNWYLRHVMKNNLEYQNKFAKALKEQGLRFFKPGQPQLVSDGNGTVIVNAGEYALIGNNPVISGGPAWGICSVVVFYKNGLPVLVLHSPYYQDVQSLLDIYQPDEIKIIEGPVGQLCGEEIQSVFKERGILFSVQRVDNPEAKIIIYPSGEIKLLRPSEQKESLRSKTSSRNLPTFFYKKQFLMPC